MSDRGGPPRPSLLRYRTGPGGQLSSLLADRGGLDKVLARTESIETYDEALWQAVAGDLGCAGLLIPERAAAPAPPTARRARPPRRWAARWPRFRSSAAPSSPPPRC